MHVDGRLDEDVYSRTPAITAFIQQQPRQGAPTTERTEAWVLFDDTNLYIACRCWDEHPERIVGKDMRHDSNNLNTHDSFGVSMDTFFDGRNGFQLYVTAAGGMREGLVTDERFYVDWNGVWESKVSRFKNGWIAELAIPFKTLRYGPGRSQRWRLQLRRNLAGKGEMTFLTSLPPNFGFGGLNHFAQAPALVGLEVPPAARNLEVKPYAMSRVTTDLLSRPVLHHDVEPDAGIDLKYGITKSLTADFSYNTDFAQVEADEAQVNLTRFSLSFPEKRDFFLEGQGTFQFGGTGGGDVGGAAVPTIFYSRRIGLSGSRAVPVIVGGRLNGKVGGWSIGALNIETDADAAANVEKTNFSVLRLRRDVLRRSNIGGLVTHRSVATSAPGSNDVWGLDANFAFFENVYVAGYLAQSRTEGRRGDDLSYRTQFNYNADRYGLALDRLVVEKHFNPEVGLLRRDNFRRSYALARFSPRTTKNPVVRKWTYNASLDHITDNRNVLESRNLGGEFRTDFHNSDAFSVQYQRLYELLKAPFQVARGVRIPKGGYDFDNLVVTYTAGSQRRLSGSPSLETGRFYDGDKKTAALKGRVELTPQLSVEPNISLNWIDLPEGRFTNTVTGVRSVFTMTPLMFVSALVQYTSSNTSLSTNLRFRWEYQPGSEMFVVYTEGRSTLPPSGTDLENRGLVVKINHLFRF